MSRKFRVAFIYNVKPKLTGERKRSVPEDEYAEFDAPRTIADIRDAIASAGHEVVDVEMTFSLIVDVRRARPDIAFNIAEGFTGESRESVVPAILEWMRVPFTGSGALTLGIALNKMRAKQVLSCHGVASAPYVVLDAEDDPARAEVPLPAIVKPLFEGSSKGIHESAVVETADAMRRAVKDMAVQYRQPVIVEKLLTGREFTVGVVGNGKPVVLPPIELDFSVLPKESRGIYSYEAKYVWDTEKAPLRIFKPLQGEPALGEKLSGLALKVVSALDVKDVARVDFRMDESGEIYLLEVNPLPGLIKNPAANSCLPAASYAAGWSFERLVNEILDAALRRHGMID